MKEKKEKIVYTSKFADISECGQFRYTLRRTWDEGAHHVCFVMLNPSTADGEEDDATIRKCVGFAHRNGYGGIVVMNLFAYRATKPKDLKAAGFPVGPENDRWLKTAVESGMDIICAWGANANRTRRPAEVCMMLRNAGGRLLCLDMTNEGFPAHPLMLSYDLKPYPYAY